MANVRFSMCLFMKDRSLSISTSDPFEIDFFYATPASDWYINRDISDPYLVNAEFERVKSLKRMSFEFTRQTVISRLLQEMHQKSQSFDAAIQMQLLAPGNAIGRVEMISFQDAFLVNFRPSNLVGGSEEGHLRFQHCAFSSYLYRVSL